MGQRAKAKNVARLDRSWYTVQAADLRQFIIYDCRDICSLAEAGKVLQVICGYQKAVIKGLLVVRRSHYSGAPRAREARAWAEPYSLVNLPIPENLVIT